MKIITVINAKGGCGKSTIAMSLAVGREFEFVVIDSPNQISPVMENCIYPSDAFIVPFESTNSVRSYANFFQLLLRIRPGEEHRVLHVLSNLSRQLEGCSGIQHRLSPSGASVPPDTSFLSTG